MKKSLIALAALAAVGAASAQSSVTLYGVIDTNYGWTRDTVQIDGLKVEKTQTKLNPGYNLSSTRWGLKGQEDLGNGLSAVFNVEAGFNSSTGDFTKGFSRRAVVGLKGNFGQVVVGKDWTPIDGIASSYQALDEVTGDKLGGALGNELLAAHIPSSPLGDTIKAGALRATGLYTSQVEGIHYSGNFSGVNVQAFAGYDNSDMEIAGFATVVKDKKEGAGIGLGYASGPFAINAAVQYFANTNGLAHNPYELKTRTTEFGLGASYDFGSAKLMGHYLYSKPKFTESWTSTSISSKAIQQVGLGLNVPMGAATVGVQYAYNFMGAQFGIPRVYGHDYGVQGTYALSKRTDLYARAARLNSWKVKGEDAKAYSDMVLVGVRHKF